MNTKQSVHRVSIGMPVYNGARYLEESLQSVIKQSFSDFIVFISDNASTDDTAEICRQYESQDDRIVYSRNSVNLGAAGNYEKCFSPAKSEYFRWQNADDVIEPTLIEKCVNVLDEHSDVVLAYGKTRFIDQDSMFVSTYEDNLALMQDKQSERFIACLQNIRLQHLMYGLIRRDALTKTARIGAYVSSDINLIAELTLFGKFFEIQDHLFSCRRHEECLSWDMSNTDKIREFWNPARKRLFLQTWRNQYEYYKAVLRSPLDISEKRVTYQYLIKQTYWQNKLLRSELSEFFRYGVLRQSESNEDTIAR